MIRPHVTRVPLGVWVALGGGVGTVARFLMGGWVTTWVYAPFPWATLAVNVTGSTLLGCILRAVPAEPAGATRRAFLAVGVCGGFTTFSTFDLELFSLLQTGRYAAAGAYAVLSVGSCIAGLWAGFAVTGALRGRLAA